MDYYVYQANVYCESCGEALRNKLDFNSSFSEEYPKGPYPIDQYESDTPDYCAGCCKFMENPLNSDIYAYVIDEIIQTVKSIGNLYGNEPEATKELADFYGITLDDVFKAIERIK